MNHFNIRAGGGDGHPHADQIDGENHPHRAGEAAHNPLGPLERTRDDPHPLSLLQQDHRLEIGSERQRAPDLHQIAQEPERTRGLEEADAVVAVSDYTCRKIAERYRINPKKIEVVPNAVDHSKYEASFAADMTGLKKNGKKIVLFVGRLTFQKGPDYFLRAAQKMAQLDPKVMFVFSGAGDMERWLIQESARLGIADRVIFAGFLRGNDLSRLYQMADLYVMPSVSEPFGITSLEALANGTPILVSRQSGVAEMVSHCLKVDFWDIDQIANKIMAVIKYPELRQTLHYNGLTEVHKFSWKKSAQKCVNVYHKVLRA